MHHESGRRCSGAALPLLLLPVWFSISAPPQARAIPGFARRHDVSSRVLRAGKMVLREGEATRGAVGFSRFPLMAPVLEHLSPVAFTLGHAAVGIRGGCTWASSW